MKWGELNHQTLIQQSSNPATSSRTKETILAVLHSINRLQQQRSPINSNKPSSVPNGATENHKMHLPIHQTQKQMCLSPLPNGEYNSFKFIWIFKFRY